MPYLSRNLIALLILSLAATSAYAERLLIDNRDHRVSLNSQLDCYTAASIRIDSTQPELYDNDTRQMQRLADAVRAMLNYECPEITEINIHGMLLGLEEPIFHGQLRRQDNWLVQALPVPDSENIETSSRDTWDELSLPSGTSDTNTTLSLASIQLGMQVDQVSRTLFEQFKKQPDYDDQRGVMSLYANGCPIDFDLEQHKASVQADWKCLEAHFSDRRIPTLQQLQIIQVARSDTDSVYQLLVDRYGTPANSTTRPQQQRTELNWSTDAGHSLRAILRETGHGYTITELRLSLVGEKQAGRDLARLGLML